MITNLPKKTIIFAAAATIAFFLPLIEAEAQFIAYHDFGATTGFESTGNITTHQASTDPPPVELDLSAKELVNYADGSATGVTLSIAGAIGVDVRNEAQTGPPAAGTPAALLFNVDGLNLGNGTIYDQESASPGPTTLTLSGLDPRLLYDLALYGDRAAIEDGLERFTLGGADSATNSSSTGIVSPLVTEQQSRPNAEAGHVIRWTEIAPGSDGIITVEADPSITDDLNLVYLNAMRLEQVGSPLAISQIIYSPDDDMVSLTWDSREGETYAVQYSSDLMNWDGRLGEPVEAGAGETTTQSFDVAGLTTEDGNLFFRVERQ